MDKLEEAQELFAESLDAARDQRTQIEEDLKFSDPSNPQQWDEKLKFQRENDAGGARPCLTMDRTGQYVANVAGQIGQRPPAIHTVPVDSKSDVDVSQQLDGLFRHIEYSSQAQIHYGIALTSAARAGVGYLTVRPEYVDRAMGYQEPRIASVVNPLRVVADPWSLALDGSDMDFAYLLTGISEREFKRRWPDAEAVSFGKERIEGDNKKTIYIAEQWIKEEITENLLVYTTPDGEQVSGIEEDYLRACEAAGMKLIVNREFANKKQCVTWRTMSGAEVLETPKNADGTDAYYPADSIGIIPVYGYWGINKDGRMTYCGIPRRARAAQQEYNYHISEQRAYMMAAPKSPWIGSARAVRGYEALWERASVETRALLPYNDIDEEGRPIPAPSRQQVTVSLQNHIQAAQQALADIEASIGMYQANLGAPSNETSGVAIDARKEQGEASTSHFPQNLAASLGQVGRVCLQMLPRLIDTKRQQRIIGIDMAANSVTVDPEQAEPIVKTPEGITINPNIGKYDVRVVVGASFSTQRGQAQAALDSIMTKLPGLAPALAPMWAKQLDIPDSQRLSQVLMAMAPPEVRSILDPEAQSKETPDALRQRISELEQGLQEAVGHAQAMQQEIIGARAEADQKEIDVNAATLVAQRAEAEVMSLKLEIERLTAIREIEEAREMPTDPAMLEQNKSAAMIEAERIKAESAERIKLFEIAGQVLTSNKEEAGEVEPLEVEPQIDMNAVMLQQTAESILAMAEAMRAPKQSQIHIVKNPDGSFTGQKIEV